MEAETLKVNLPTSDPDFQGAVTIAQVLRKAGHEAYVVGGAVRDLVMGMRPREYDIATSAKPHEVMALFSRTVPVGVQFGVVRVRLRGRDYEVATYRADLGYSDGRRPDAVRFTNLREDVLRRDFTMNGLALDPDTGEVVDLVGGVADIQDRLIRAIGDAGERFAEDRLRPLRAVRFAAQTGFRIEEGTWEAVVRAAPDVVRVSAERIREEMDKTLRTLRPGLGVRLMARSSILRAVAPLLAEASIWEAEVVARVLERLAGGDIVVLWAAFAWPLGAAGAEHLLRSLRHSRRMVEAVKGTVGLAHAIRGLPHPDIASEKRLLRSPHTAGALAVLQAWLAETGGDDSCVRHAWGRLETWSHEDLFPPRLLSGSEVVEAGVPPGSRVGEVLRALEDAQLRGEVRDREGALQFVEGLESVKP